MIGLFLARGLHRRSVISIMLPNSQAAPGKGTTARRTDGLLVDVSLARSKLTPVVPPSRLRANPPIFQAHEGANVCAGLGVSKTRIGRVLGIRLVDRHCKLNTATVAWKFNRDSVKVTCLKISNLCSKNAFYSWCGKTKKYKQSDFRLVEFYGLMQTTKTNRTLFPT
jgi:hypothetical protein